MNKNDLIDAVAQETDNSKTDAAKAVDSVFDTISTALKSGEDVQLIGFGSFSVADRAAREGRNPRTGEPVKVGGKYIPYFKTGKQLRERLNP